MKIFAIYRHGHGTFSIRAWQNGVCLDELSVNYAYVSEVLNVRNMLHSLNFVEINP